MKTFLLLVLLLPMLWAKSTYFVGVPRILFAGSYSTASISISSLSADATVTISLKQNGKTLATFSKVLSSSTGSQISRIPFVVDKRAGKKVQFHIKSTGGLVFDHSTDLEVKIPKDKLFIQTDKPIYKPGEKVRFRIIGIDKDLKPNFPQPIDQIYILNPTGSRMVQWTNTTLDVGMASFEMPLSIKPVLGNWKIVAKAGIMKEESNIEVKKYVLPKFKVDITPPPYIVNTDDSVTIKICGKYTYGKQVNGKLQAKICMDSQHYWRRRSDSRRRCLTFDQKIDGCANIIYNMRVDPKSPENLIRIVNSYQRFRLKIEASITEDATGIKVSANHTTPNFVKSDCTMKFDAPKKYKPGFVYKVKLLLTTPDGRPYTQSKFVNMRVKYHMEGTTKLVSKGLYQIVNGVYEFSVSPVQDAVSYSFNAAVQHVVTAKKLKRLRTPKLRRRPYISSNNNQLQQRAYASSDAWYSPSKRYIKVTDASNLNVGDVARITVRLSLNSRGKKTLNYMLVCKGNVVTTSTLVTYTWLAYLRFRVSDVMLPKCRLLVYYLHGDEFVSDNYVINFGITFKNKVSLRFGDQESKPGENVDLIMKASPGSKFAVSAVDQSIKLMAQTNDIGENEITSILTDQDITPSFKYQKREKCSTGRSSSSGRWWGRRARRTSVPWGPRYDNEGRVDGKEAIRQAGLKYFTNAQVDVLPCPRRRFYGRRKNFRVPIMAMAGGRGNVQDSAGVPGPRPRIQNMLRKVQSVNKPSIKMKMKMKPVEKKAPSEPSLKVRTEFPESWLWFDEYIGSTGEKIMSVKVPDTITTWHANGFAISASDGIGVAQPANIRSFQPFFISLSLPYSVKRGETVKIPATIFNYLDKCLVIGVSIQPSNDFTPVTSSSSKVCVCGGAAKTVKFGIKPTKLGKIDVAVHARSYEASSAVCGPNELPVSNVVAADALTKKLLVEAEGIKKEYSKSVFFCPKDYKNGIFKDQISLHLPKDVVPGSVYAELAFVGDLLGPSMNGLDKLLAMPYGCGEQNMLKFAPNVYIMDYLKATGQSDSNVENKAIEYMKSGYQRELTYKHNNGGYSAFGQRDKEASTWLTAFVLRTYAQARRYIFVDSKDITDSKKWLLSLQNKDGCFKELGMVHHKEMKGGVTGGITMTAFVVIALLEADLPQNDDRIQKAVQCMEGKLDDVTDSYTTSVLAFSLKMAGSSKANDLLKKLEQQEIRKDGFIHWEDGKSKKKTTGSIGYYHQAKSADIEMTGYALMAYLGGSKPYGSRLDQLSIVKWMSKQRNAYGGFSSTQDTCVGLQAMAQYSAAVFSGKFDLTVKTKQSLPPFTAKEVKIDTNNKLVLQKHVLDSALPFDIDVEATGDGCALVQANVKYNEQKPGLDESFNLLVKVKQDENSLTCRHTMKICGSYTGKGDSNMALIDVNMASGFEPIIDELDMMSQSTTVPFTQYEFLEGVLSFYFNEFAQTSKCVEFGIEQVSQVEDRKPAVVKIYDYYDIDNEATKMYEVGKCPEINVVS